MASDTREAFQNLQTLDSLSRRDEAVANIHRSRGIESEFTRRAADNEEAEAARERAAQAAFAKDYEGTVTDRADAAGNVAKNAQQATEGGIGVAASNSGPDEQDARVGGATGPTLATGPGGGADTPAGGGSDASDAGSVTIPDNWESLSWPERQTLAKSVSRGETVRNGDDAERVIKAELERRKS